MDIDSIIRYKFQENSNMSFQEIFDFSFKSLIPVLQNFAAQMGKEQFMEMLKKAAFDSMLQSTQESTRQLEQNDLAAYATLIKERSYFGEHVLTREIVEDTHSAFEIKVTECLWAKVFRENSAADIGYSLLCHTDHAHCQGFNPHIRMVRTKTLMQGHDCCNHRYIWTE